MYFLDQNNNTDTTTTIKLVVYGKQFIYNCQTYFVWKPLEVRNVFVMMMDFLSLILITFSHVFMTAVKMVMPKMFLPVSKSYAQETTKLRSDIETESSVFSFSLVSQGSCTYLYYQKKDASQNLLYLIGNYIVIFTHLYTLLQNTEVHRSIVHSM